MQSAVGVLQEFDRSDRHDSGGRWLHQGLPPDQRRAAAEIYWQAFGAKLGRVMGPEPRALAYLTRAIRADHCLAVTDATGALLGLAGFRSPQGSFAGGRFADMAAVYGAAGAGWRAGLFWMLEREVDNDRFLLDGICVARHARSQGIGTVLIEAICAEAARRGYRSVRLDVIDTNLRAKALYERLGFVSAGTQRIGPLRHAFGFDATTTMVRIV